MRYGKRLIYLCLLLISEAGWCQTTKENIDITGLWKGTLFNDTTQLFYQYEIGISAEKGKLTGFSHTWFLFEDKQYYGVKKVKVKRVGSKIIIEDAGLISHNYPTPPSKGVRQLNVLELEIKDSIITLSGPFSTNRTRDYSSLTGTVSLQRKNDYWQSALVPHLQELGLEKQLTFVEDTFSLDRSLLAVGTKKANTDGASQTITPPQITGVKFQEIPDLNKDDKSKPDSLSVSSTITRKQNIADPIKVAQNAQQPIKEIAAPVTTELSIPSASEIRDKSRAPAADLKNRVTISQQTVIFRSDSLQLALYDNGEVDGDTVSVLMNGVIIMAKQGLSTQAIRKTIYIDPKTDSVQLIMYAENLGTIAPNTGLLVVRDGRDLYEIRFSGDLQKNAAVIFRRKK